MGQLGNKGSANNEDQPLVESKDMSLQNERVHHMPSTKLCTVRDIVKFENIKLKRRFSKLLESKNKIFLLKVS